MTRELTSAELFDGMSRPPKPSVLAPSFEQVAAWLETIREALPAVDSASREALDNIQALVIQRGTANEVLIRRVEQLERTRLVVVRSAGG